MNRPLPQILAAAVASVALAGCVSDETLQPFKPLTLGDPQRQAATGLATSDVVALPAKLESLADSKKTPKETFKNEPLLGRIDAGPRVVMVDLRNAIQRAAVNNLDVKVAGYTPAIDETRVTEADARFDPTAFVNFTSEWNRAFVPIVNGSYSDGRFNRLNVETGIKQDLDTGGNYSVQLQSQEVNVGTSSTGTSTDNRTFFQELKLQITQPILRDFGRDINQARIVINKNNQQISLLDFREQLEKSLEELEKTYWQLVQARREVEIEQELLQNTINTANTLYLRMNSDVNRLQISQANASVETRRAQLVRAQANVADLSDDLKRSMNDPRLPIGGPELLLPGTKPSEQQVLIDPAEQIDTALLNRTELGQQQIRGDSARIALNVARNNKLPKFDLVGSVSVQGVDGKFIDSFGDLGSNNGDNYNGVATIGFQFEYPLGNRAAQAIYRRAQLQFLQSGDAYRGYIVQIVNETTKAARDVNTSWSEIVRYRQATFAAQDALRSVQVREDAGEALTPEFVNLKLNQQDTLAQAQRAEAGAVSGYNTALSRLERVKGTLLKYNNVVMSEASLPRGK